MKLRALLLLAVPLGGIGATACFDATFCEAHPDRCNVGGAAGTGSGNETGSQSGSSSTGIPDECDPMKLASGAAIPASCGIFVEPGHPAGDGSQANPFGTLAEALASSNTKTIYVCSTSAEGLDESAAVTSQSLLGKLECGTWKGTTTKTAWTGPANAPVLTLAAPTNVTVSGFAIAARNAIDFDPTTLQGHSSVGVLVDGGTAGLVGVDVTAANGAAGGDGADQTDQAPGRNTDAAKFNGVEGGTCGLGPGVLDPISDCPTGGTTQAGDGGAGNHTVGGSGNAGSPDPGPVNPNGEPGAGETGSGWDCGTNGGNGELGHVGLGGADKAGMKGSLLGTFTVATLYSGDPGHPGDAGAIGQGGGGGGGRKGDGSNGCGATTKGPSGGSGGAGGCGGFGGGGGGAGGASIALVSLASSLTLTDVHLKAAPGGAGGAGGDGQLGGSGGNGANGGGVACTGGAGGNGGNGGPGGGGRGGPSIGLASTGTAPDLDDGLITIAGQAAAGGDGGNGNLAANKGDAGLLASKQDF